MRRKVLGGRGNLGIINNLRRQIIYLINWELNISRDEQLILKLLRLLIISVGSEHYRSMTAIEILQCLDNVMKTFINKKTRHSWTLLLNGIGKHNVIFRDYILYCTFNILKSDDNNESLQNLEAKSIHWKLGNNFLYLLYNLILKGNDANNDEIQKCMNVCFEEKITPPKSLIELFLKRNTCKDLIMNNNFVISINLIIFIMNKLSEINNLDEFEIYDYIELLTLYQLDISKKIFPRALNNPFNNNINKAMENIIQLKQIDNNNDGFFHYIKLKSIISNIESFPWNIKNWYLLLDLIKQILLFFSKTFLIDICFSLKKIFSDIYKEFNIDSNFSNSLNLYLNSILITKSLNEFDISIIKNKLMVKLIESLNYLFIKDDIFYRYFNLKNIDNILTEMQSVRFKVYSLLCMFNEVCGFIKIYFKDEELSYKLNQKFSKVTLREFFDNKISDISDNILIASINSLILFGSIFEKETNIDILKDIFKRNIQDQNIVLQYIYIIDLCYEKTCIKNSIEKF